MLLSKLMKNKYFSSEQNSLKPKFQMLWKEVMFQFSKYSRKVTKASLIKEMLNWLEN